jgi:putative tricarboxylic transport membrane protein
MGRTVRIPVGLVSVSLCLDLAGCGGSSPASETLTLLAPAAPGGGWDQTARVMQQFLRSTDLAKTAQVINVPVAGGVMGLAQVVNSHEGDANL